MTVTNQPVNGTFSITAVYGQQGSRWKNGHKGVDYTAAAKTLYSLCDGTLTVLGWDSDGWGRYWSIQPKGFPRIRFILAHGVQNSSKVAKGAALTRTTALGTMGTTGNSSGVHTHVEMRIDNVAVNPCEYLGIPNKTGTYKSSNYTFDPAKQSAVLQKMQDAFDKKNAPVVVPPAVDYKAKYEAEVKAHISTKTTLAIANTNLANADTKRKSAENKLDAIKVIVLG